MKATFQKKVKKLVNIDAPNQSNTIYINRIIFISDVVPLLLLPDPFRGMTTWRLTMEPQKPGNSPRSGPEVAQRQRVAKERAAKRACSWTVQNEMKGVLGWVSASAA